MLNCRIHLILFVVLLVILPCRLHALTASAFFPANNATNFCADTPLKITFDAPPAIGTSGAVRIYSSTGALVDSLDLAVGHTRAVGGKVYNAYPILVTGTTASIFPRSDPFDPDFAKNGAVLDFTYTRRKTAPWPPAVSDLSVSPDATRESVHTASPNGRRFVRVRITPSP